MVRGGVSARPWWDTSNPDERLSVTEYLPGQEKRREVRALSLAPILYRVGCMQLNKVQQYAAGGRRTAFSRRCAQRYTALAIEVQA